jgi:hypothetical protein
MQACYQWAVLIERRFIAESHQEQNSTLENEPVCELGLR